MTRLFSKTHKYRTLEDTREKATEFWRKPNFPIKNLYPNMLLMWSYKKAVFRHWSSRKTLPLYDASQEVVGEIVPSKQLIRRRGVSVDAVYSLCHSLFPAHIPASLEVVLEPCGRILDHGRWEGAMSPLWVCECPEWSSGLFPFGGSYYETLSSGWVFMGWRATWSALDRHEWEVKNCVELLRSGFCLL